MAERKIGFGSDLIEGDNELVGEWIEIEGPSGRYGGKLIDIKGKDYVLSPSLQKDYASEIPRIEFDENKTYVPISPQAVIKIKNKEYFEKVRDIENKKIDAPVKNKQKKSKPQFRGYKRK